MIKRVRNSSELPDDVGTVFVTHVQDASFQIVGRRDPATSELYVGSLLWPRGPLEQAIKDIKQEFPGTEIVTGEEAEDLIKQVMASWATVSRH